MVKHDGDCAKFPAAKFSGFLKLSKSSFSLGRGQVDRRSFHLLVRSQFQLWHGFVVRSTWNRVRDATCLFRVWRAMLPHSAYEPTRVPGQPITVTSIGQQPISIHVRILEANIQLASVGA